MPDHVNPLDERHEYSLSHVLKAHSSDVRSLASAYDDLSDREILFSASRDTTGVYWSRKMNEENFTKGPTFRGERFCNSVEYIHSCPQLPRGQILLGFLDSTIRCFDPLMCEKPLQILSDHWDNVSSIKPYQKSGSSPPSPLSDVPPCFISASWDATARIWILDSSSSQEPQWKPFQILKGHDQAVWGVAIVDPPFNNRSEPQIDSGRYLTSSADLFVRLFHGQQLYAVYAGHMDVARSIALLCQTQDSEKDEDEQEKEPLFATSSNDTTIRIWSLDAKRSPTPGNGGDPVRILQGHTSLVYDLATVSTGKHSNLLISSGEDGTVRVWDWRSGNLQQTISLPVISVWSVTVMPQTGDLVAGSSDGLVRVFTRNPITYPSQDSQGAGQIISRSELTAETAKALEMQQSQKEQTSSSSQGQGKPREKQLFESKYYDEVLMIDVSDDSDPLPLPMNFGDDIHQVAKTFVEKRHLPESYQEQIVDFINTVLDAGKNQRSNVKQASPTTQQAELEETPSSPSNRINNDTRTNVSPISTDNTNDPWNASNHMVPLFNPEQLANFQRNHFQDAPTREFFREQLQSNLYPQHLNDDGVSTQPSDQVLSQAQLEDAWAALQPGETEEEWQERHGMSYLTPQAVAIFDQSRRFRETRDSTQD